MSDSVIVLAIALQRYLDAPPIAQRARSVAISMAKSERAVLHVLTVEAPVALLPDAQTLEEKLEHFVLPIKQAGIGVSHHILHGRPEEQIVGFVTSVGADWLIIGSHSKRGLLDIGLGTTADSLARNSPCSVVMVWPTLEETEKAKSFIIPGYPFVFPYG